MNSFFGAIGAILLMTFYAAAGLFALAWFTFFPFFGLAWLCGWLP